MKPKIFSFLPLLLWAVTMAATPTTSRVPAMIVHGTDGGRQVVQLDATDITDIIVLQNGQSLSVDIPEAQISGVRSIIIAMVAADDITTTIESTDAKLVHSVEKLIRDGQVILCLHMQNGTVLEYDIHGKIIK